MALETENDQLGFLDTETHGLTVSYTPSGGSASNIKAIVNDEYFGIDGDSVDIEGKQIFLTCRTSNAPNAAHGDTFAFESKTFKVVNVRPDGTGFTEMVLEEQ
jgi:hypothetical protein